MDRDGQTPGMESDTLDPTPPSRVVDFDISCLSCGYNLRGLAGDPLRCPECGHLNPLGETEIPEALITARLRRMETSLVVCVGAVLFALPWQFMLWSLLVDALGGKLGPNAVSEIVSCAGVPAFSPMVVWLVAVFWFRASCRGEPGWGRVLARYHLYGLGVGGAMLAAMLAIPVVLSPIGRGMRLSNFLVPVVVFGGAIVGVRRLLVAPYRRLMVGIHELQRKAAISKIREEARHRVQARQESGV